jgi:hypothetical protein
MRSQICAETFAGRWDRSRVCSNAIVCKLRPSFTAYTRARIMRTPARALCLSQQGNPHGSLCKTLRTPSGCSTWHTHWLQQHTHDSNRRAIIHTNSVTFIVSKRMLWIVTFSHCQKSLRMSGEEAIHRRRNHDTLLPDPSIQNPRCSGGGPQVFVVAAATQLFVPMEMHSYRNLKFMRSENTCSKRSTSKF